MPRYGGTIPAAKWASSWNLAVALGITALLITIAAILVLVFTPRWQRDAKLKVIEREEQVRIASEHVRVRAVRTKKWAERIEAKLNEERARLESEKTDMTCYLQRNQDKIKLNVGGHRYETTVATLRESESAFFQVLLSGRWEVKVEEDDGSTVFIDRDGLSFRWVLSYLRNEGHIPWRFLTALELSMLIKEAEYFQMPVLRRKVQTALDKGSWTDENETIHDAHRRRLWNSGASVDGDDHELAALEPKRGGGGLSSLSPFIWWPNFFISRRDTGKGD